MGNKLSKGTKSKDNKGTKIIIPTETMTFDDNCDSLEKCISLRRIKQILDFYQFINKNNKDKKDDEIQKLLIQYINDNKYNHLINDFHHILLKHLGKSDDKQNMLNYANH